VVGAVAGAGAAAASVEPAERTLEDRLKSTLRLCQEEEALLTQSDHLRDDGGEIDDLGGQDKDEEEELAMESDTDSQLSGLSAGGEEEEGEGSVVSELTEDDFDSDADDDSELTDTEAELSELSADGSLLHAERERGFLSDEEARFLAEATSQLARAEKLLWQEQMELQGVAVVKLQALARAWVARTRMRAKHVNARSTDGTDAATVLEVRTKHFSLATVARTVEVAQSLFDKLQSVGVDQNGFIDSDAFKTYLQAVGVSSYAPNKFGVPRV
jgi:hypothetical protein